MISPLLKDCADSRIVAGERCIVVDLEACTGMDSTFMGLLAGLSARLSKLGGEGVQIAGAGERNRRSLEDLGLDCLLEIDPPAASWRGHAAEVRSLLEPYRAGKLPDLRERARQVLDAHRNLANTSDANAKRFAGVLSVLEDEVARNEGNPG